MKVIAEKKEVLNELLRENKQIGNYLKEQDKNNYLDAPLSHDGLLMQIAQLEDQAKHQKNYFLE